MRLVYNGIEFAKEWKGSFADFKKEFERLHQFRPFDPIQREKVMKKLHKDLIKHNTKNVISRAPKKSPATDTGKTE